MKQRIWKNHKKLAVGVLLALATGGGYLRICGREGVYDADYRGDGG